MIPVDVDWPAVVYELRRRGLRDKDVFDRMADQGIVAHHDALYGLRTGRIKSPQFETGAALLNVLKDAR